MRIQKIHNARHFVGPCLKSWLPCNTNFQSQFQANNNFNPQKVSICHTTEITMPIRITLQNDIVIDGTNCKKELLIHWWPNNPAVQLRSCVVKKGNRTAHSQFRYLQNSFRVIIVGLYRIMVVVFLLVFSCGGRRWQAQLSFCFFKVYDTLLLSALYII